MIPSTTLIEDIRRRAIKIDCLETARSMAAESGLNVVDGKDTSWWLVSPADARRLISRGFHAAPAA